MYSLWISRIQMLSTLSIYSPANLNLFFRFGLSENLQSDSGTAMQSEKQVSFPLPAFKPVSGRCSVAVRSLTVYVYSCILGFTVGQMLIFRTKT